MGCAPFFLKKYFESCRIKNVYYFCNHFNLNDMRKKTISPVQISLTDTSSLKSDCATWSKISIGKTTTYDGIFSCLTLSDGDMDRLDWSNQIEVVHNPDAGVDVGVNVIPEMGRTLWLGCNQSSSNHLIDGNEEYNEFEYFNLPPATPEEYLDSCSRGTPVGTPPHRPLEINIEPVCTYHVPNIPISYSYLPGINSASLYLTIPSCAKPEADSLIRHELILYTEPEAKKTWDKWRLFLAAQPEAREYLVSKGVLTPYLLFNNDNKYINTTTDKALLCAYLSACVLGTRKIPLSLTTAIHMDGNPNSIRTKFYDAPYRPNFERKHKEAVRICEDLCDIYGMDFYALLTENKIKNKEEERKI